MSAKRRHLNRELARIEREKVSRAQWKLFVSIIQKRKPNLVGSVRSLKDFSSLEDKVREALREALLEEFCATGLRVDSEPNERGLILEQLIDRLGSD